MIHVTELEKTTASCPSQWEGRTDDGQHIYIRYRHGILAAAVGPDLDEAIDRTWREPFHLEQYGEKWEGSMPTRTMVVCLRKHVVFDPEALLDGATAPEPAAQPEPEEEVRVANRMFRAAMDRYIRGGGKVSDIALKVGITREQEKNGRTYETGDTTGLLRAIGHSPTISRGSAYFQRTVSLELAHKLCDALELDYTEVGI